MLVNGKKEKKNSCLGQKVNQTSHLCCNSRCRYVKYCTTGLMGYKRNCLNMGDTTFQEGFGEKV